MALKAPKPGKTEKILPPEGSHVARIYQLIELGTIEGFQGKMQHKLLIGFELPNETHVFKEGDEPKPFAISKEFTFSMFESAPFRKLVEAVVGKGMTEDEAAEYNAEDLVGKTLTITIKHKKSEAGNVYARVDATSPVMKGITVPDPVNPPLVWTFEKDNPDVYKALPEFIREKIESSVQRDGTELTEEDTPF